MSMLIALGAALAAPFLDATDPTPEFTCFGAGEELSGCPDEQPSTNTADNAEDCDDSNVVTEICAYGEASCEVCGSECKTQAGAVQVCGDGSLQGPEV